MSKFHIKRSITFWQKIGSVKPVFRGQLHIKKKVSVYDRLPFIAGSLIWGNNYMGHHSDKTTLRLSTESHLKTGFTEYCTFNLTEHRYTGNTKANENRSALYRHQLGNLSR